MPDIYVKKDPSGDRYETTNPHDQTLQPDPKKFGYENNLHKPWGWYPFIYQSRKSLQFGGLFPFDFVGGAPLPAINFNPSIEIVNGPGGTPGHPTMSDFEEAMVEALCNPDEDAEPASDFTRAFCEHEMDNCDFMKFMMKMLAIESSDFSDSTASRIGAGSGDTLPNEDSPVTGFGSKLRAACGEKTYSVEAYEFKTLSTTAAICGAASTGQGQSQRVTAVEFLDYALRLNIYDPATGGTSEACRVVSVAGCTGSSVGYDVGTAIFLDCVAGVLDAACPECDFASIMKEGGGGIDWDA